MVVFSSIHLLQLFGNEIKSSLNIFFACCFLGERIVGSNNTESTKYLNNRKMIRDGFERRHLLEEIEKMMEVENAPSKSARIELARECGFTGLSALIRPRSFPKRPYSRVRDSLAIFMLIFLLLLNNIEVQK